MPTPDRAVYGVMTPQGPQASIYYYWHASGDIERVTYDDSGAELSRMDGFPAGPNGRYIRFAVTLEDDGGHRVNMHDMDVNPATATSPQTYTIWYDPTGTETNRTVEG